MFCELSQKMILPFAMTFLVGVLLVNSLQPFDYPANIKSFNLVNSQSETEINLNPSAYPTFYIKSDECKGTVRESGDFRDEKFENYFDVNIDSKSVNCINYISNSEKIIFTSKPKSNNTSSAKQTIVQGSMSLNVIFLKNGQIGSICDIKGLPKGLSEYYRDLDREHAIFSARRIVFEPSTTNKIPQIGGNYVQYTFTIY